jgi:hypothetical protein
MKNTPYLLLLISLFIFSCKETPKKEISENRTSALVPEPDLNLRLTGEKTSVDSTLIKSKKALKFIKIDDKQAPKMVKLDDETDYETAFLSIKIRRIPSRQLQKCRLLKAVIGTPKPRIILIIRVKFTLFKSN